MKSCNCYALRAIDCTCLPEKYDEIYTTSDQEPVAWRTFDGEGLYFYCSYEDNETYADVWNKRNPNHKGWVEPLYTTPPPQRTWVGLTDEEKAQFVVAYYPSNWDRKTAVALMSDYEKYLKEKNFD